MADSQIHYNKLVENKEGVKSKENFQDNHNETKFNEKFLFLFSPKYTALVSCCGCSLESGAFLISILQIISSLSSFTAGLNTDSNFKILINGLLFLSYFTAGLLIYLSSINKDFKNCFSAYLIYVIIFLINVMDSLVISLLILVGLHNPFYDINSKRAFLLYVSMSIIFNTIQLYFVWIIYSYAISLKKENNDYILIKTICEKDENLI